MKKALFFAGLAAAFAFTGCNREADLAGNGKSVNIILSNVDTRTVNESMSTLWADNDELTVFYAPAGTETWSANTKFTVTDASTNRATGEVELTADAYDWYLFYPYTRQLPNPTTLNPEGSTYERSGYTTVGGQFQTQAGDGDMAHLAGKKVPVYGNVKNVAAADMPVVTMKNAAAVVRFAVQNKLSEPIHILSVKFTAPEDIVGTYYIDFSGDAPSFVGSGDTYVFDNVTVTNGNPLSIAADVTPEFYAVIKPFTAPAGSKLKVEIEAESADGLKRGSVTKEVTLTEAATFQAGKFKTLNLKFDGTLTKVTAEELPYEEPLTDELGAFTVENVTGTGIWSLGTAGSQKCMKGTSYQGSNKEGEGWLISPEIDGTTAEDGIKLSFMQCVNKYFGTVAEEATLWAREKGGEWTQYTITYPTPNGTWSAFEEQVVDLSAFMGKTFQFAFKYVGHEAAAGTWEIYNVAVTDEAVAAYTFLAELQGEEEIPASATSVTIKVTGNVAWTAEPSEGVTLDKTSGEGNATITASFAANTATTPKNHSVVVRTDNTEVENDEWEITFTQAAYDNSNLQFTWDLTTASYNTPTSETEVIWSADAATMKAEKDKATTPANNYLGGDENKRTSSRFYSGSKLTITPATGITILFVEFTATSEGYATALANSTWTNAAAAVDETNKKLVTVTPTDGTLAMVAAIGGTCGFTGVTVHYSGSAKDLVSIAVSGQKTDFTVGDTFTHDTAVVTATYSDNSQKDVTASATFSAPDMATAGTKEVTVSYTEGVTKTTSYNITVSAPTTLTVSQAVALADDATGTVGDAIVAAICTKGFIATDGTQNVYVFMSKQPEVALGDKVSFSFKKTTYYGLPELTTITNLTVASHDNTIPRTTLTDITSTLDTYTSSDTDYLTVTGTLEKSGNYYNVRVTGATRYATPMYLYEIDPSALVGQQVVMTGYFNTINSGKGAVQFIATEIKAADANAKYCVVSPDVLNADATATSATLSIHANAAWTVSSDNSAFTVSPASGSADATVTISFAANEAQEAKVANITVACPDASVSKTIVLTQAGKDASGTVTVTANQSFLAANKNGQIDDVVSYTNDSDYGSTVVTELRVYKNKTLTVTATAGHTIKSIKMTCTKNGTTKEGPGCWGAGAPDGYTFETNGPTGTWTGSASTVSFTAKDNQVRIIELVVTYE